MRATRSCFHCHLGFSWFGLISLLHPVLISSCFFQWVLVTGSQKTSRTDLLNHILTCLIFFFFIFFLFSFKILSLIYLLEPHEIPRLICIFLTPVLEPTTSPLSLASLSLGNDVQTLRSVP